MPLIQPVLPADFHARHPTLDDASTVVPFLRFCQQQESGASEANIVDTLNIWQAPEVDLSSDVWLVFTASEQLVAYLHLGHRVPSRMQVILKVHPDYTHSGLYAALFTQAEERASTFIEQVPAEVRVSLYADCNGLNRAYKWALEQAGYSHIRTDWRMEIVLDAPPPAANWPEGITLRPFTREMARAVHAADEEAFLDHRGFIPSLFESFEHWHITTPRFDPTLWFVAYEGETIAGSAICEYWEGIAFINSLSVRRPWRRRGLGLSLLQHAFGEFYRRGYPRANLYVDSQSLTGAMRLYERAGMHVIRQFDKYEKELRSGTELSIQALAE